MQKVKLDGYQGSVGFGLGTQFNHSASANVTVKKKHVVSSARIGLYTHPNGGTIYSTRAGNDQNGIPYYLIEQGSRRAHDYTLSVGYNVTWEVDTTLSVSAKLSYTKYHINSTDDLFYTSQSNSPALTEQFRLIQGRIAANSGLTASLNLDKAWSPRNSGSLSLLLGRNTDKIDNTFAQDATVPTADDYQDQRNEVAIQAQGVHSIPALGRLEVGTRGVVRTNQANYVNQSASGLPDLADRLDYNQRTLALYVQHSVPYKKLEIQYGLRAEYYAAHLTSAAVSDYQQRYYNLFPSASVLYNLSDAQTLKLAYFRKTTRPGITYLNVFQDRRNPKDFVVGNSALVPEFKTGFELTYNFSGKKVYLTSTLYTATVRDAILSYVLPTTGNVVNTTYGNVGRETSVGLDTNTSYSLGKFTLNSQVTVEYYAARNQVLGFGNHGLRVSSSTQLGYKAKAGWYVEVSGDLETRRILLNGTQSGWNYASLTIEKSFADKFLCRFLMRDIFNTSNFTAKYTDFFDYTYQYRPQVQAFIFSFTYKFGKNFSYKRAQDGLNLDDIKEKSVK